MYDATVNDRSVGVTYTTFDRNATYTVAKFRLNLANADGPSARICFAMTAGPCGSLQGLCAGPSCMYSLAEEPSGGATCCPVDTKIWW
jgi:hypothetical protein